MNRRLRHAGLGLLALSLVVTAAARAETATSIRSVTAADMQWTNLRPGLDRVLLLGDPATSGPFVYRIRAPAGLDAGFHTHSADLNSTILSGAVIFEYDGEQHRLDAGSFVSVPANKPHRELVVEATEMEVRGVGPVTTTPIE